MSIRELIFTTAEPKRESPWQGFLDFCKGQWSGWSELRGSSGANSRASSLDKLTDRPLDQSNLVCSDRRVDNQHIPVLDIDMPAMLLPSSTPGHHHLFIDKPMSWEDYCKLLDVMAEVGILEQGYIDVSKARKRTQVRTPWTKK